MQNEIIRVGLVAIFGLLMLFFRRSEKTLITILPRLTYPVLVLWIALLVFQGSPFFGVTTDIDAGVYRYIGWRIVEGEVPYQDVWDHKPPVIFFLNALGLAIGRGSIWGIWFLELAAIGCAGVLSFRLLNRYLGFFPASWGTVLWLVMLLKLTADGRLDNTETFVLPLQFIALFLFLRADGKPLQFWAGYTLGLTFALAFLLKQIFIGVWVALFLYILVKRIAARSWHELFAEGAAILAGGVTVFGVIVLYFASKHALDDLWRAAFQYNFLYAEQGSDPQEALSNGLTFLDHKGFIYIALAGWAAALIGVVKRIPNRKSVQALFIVLVIWLPVEALLVCTTSGIHQHYYQTSVAVLGLLVGVTAYVYHALSDRYRRAGLLLILVAVSYFNFIVRDIASPVLSFLDVGVSPAKSALVDGTPFVNQGTYLRDPLADYINDHTDKHDYVLVWGYSSGTNFLARRVSPTPFVYQLPFGNREYVTPAIIDEFIDDLRRHAPALILDTMYRNDLWQPLPPLDAEARRTWSAMTGATYYQPLDAFFAFVQQHCEVETDILTTRIYRCSLPQGTT